MIQRYLAIALLCAVPGNALAITDHFANAAPFEQDVVITAYYSPLPDQCCYVKGDLQSDLELNGQGIRGADGTDVYPGMLAAPPSYPYGTRVVLPGIGTLTVHDRGGAIQEWKNAHRLDIWVGHGEEGLARALAFGVRRMRATVYPLGTSVPKEELDLAALPAPPEKLRPYLAEDTTLFHIHAKRGDRTASVLFLQQQLRLLRAFAERPTGFFGPATEASLRSFYDELGITEPSDHLTERGAAFIEAALKRKDAVDPVRSVVDVGSAPMLVMEAQRTLRFLGLYKGRTNGLYDATMRAAVLAFQRARGIVASATEPGAGRIGPKTRSALALAWRARHVEKTAERLLAHNKLERLIASKMRIPTRFLDIGDRGSQVRLLQEFLVSRKLLSQEDLTGTFGPKTRSALLQYQRSEEIVASAADAGAGTLGPATLQRIRRQVKEHMLRIVRAKGITAI